MEPDLRPPIMKSTVFALCALFAVAPAAFPQARDRSEAWKKLLERFDKDADGKISASEFDRGPRVFKRLDKNGDGFIDESEFKNSGAPVRKETPKPAAPTEVELQILEHRSRVAAALERQRHGE